MVLNVLIERLVFMLYFFVFVHIHGGTVSVQQFKVGQRSMENAMIGISDRIEYSNIISVRIGILNIQALVPTP